LPFNSNTLLNTSSGKTGIGVAVPTNTLHVNGANPLRLEGLQQSSLSTVGTLVTESTGVVKFKNYSNVSAVRVNGVVNISPNNIKVNTDATATPSKLFDNLNEFVGNKFTAVQSGLYQISFNVNFPQRTNTSDNGDGYLGINYINLNGIQYDVFSQKINLPEATGAPFINTANSSVLVKMNATDVLTFQILIYGSTGNLSNVNYTINIVRVD
jgi:hypothetical protein